MAVLAYTAMAMDGPFITLWTVRLALACYFASAACQLLAGHDRRPHGDGPRRLHTAARVTWTIGCALFMAHVAAAFGFYHHWSHAAAFEHTAQRTRALVGIDFGGGLWFNYAFTAAWAADAAWWWYAGDRRYRRRRRATTAALHVFFLFMIFNATVVFASGPVRWLALSGIAALAVLCARRTWARRDASPRA